MRAHRPHRPYGPFRSLVCLVPLLAAGCLDSNVIGDPAGLNGKEDLTMGGLMDATSASDDGGVMDLTSGGQPGDLISPPSITFAAPSQVPLGRFPQALAAADFNGDKIVDLVATNNWDDTVSVVLGNGNGSFQPGVAYAAGKGPSSLAVGDLDRDGFLDVVVTDTTSVLFLRGAGDGTLAAPVVFVAVAEPTGVAIGDLDEDGAPDLVVSITGGDVAVMLGDGQGGFGHPATFAGGEAQALSVAAVDLDRDGHLDLVVPHDSFDDVGVLLGLGNGRFGAAAEVRTGAGPRLVAIANLDGDGHPDLVAPDRTSQNPSTLTVVLRKGGGRDVTSAYPTGAGPSQAAVGDFNGDHSLDIACVNSDDQTVTVLGGDGQGGFVASGTLRLPVVGPAPGIVSADFNGDQHLDLAVLSGDSAAIYLGH